MVNCNLFDSSKYDLKGQIQFIIALSDFFNNTILFLNLKVVNLHIDPTNALKNHKDTIFSFKIKQKLKTFFPIFI